MTRFTRPLFALLMMGLIAAALALATLGWVESHRQRSRRATDASRPLDATETAGSRGGRLELVER